VRVGSFRVGELEGWRVSGCEVGGVLLDLQNMGCIVGGMRILEMLSLDINFYRMLNQN